MLDTRSVRGQMPRKKKPHHDHGGGRRGRDEGSRMSERLKLKTRFRSLAYVLASEFPEKEQQQLNNFIRPY